MALLGWAVPTDTQGMKLVLALAMLTWLASASGVQARETPRSKAERLRKAQEAETKRDKLASKKKKNRRKKKQQEEEEQRLARLRARRRRSYGVAGRSVAHRVAATGTVLSRPQAQRLAADKIPDQASARLAQLAGTSSRSPSGGVDPRGVEPISQAERAAAQKLPSAQLPKDLARNAAAPPAPELAEMPGGQFFDKLGDALSKLWGPQTQPTIDALKVVAQKHNLTPKQTVKVAGLITTESHGRYWLDHGTGMKGRKKYTSSAKGPMQVVCGTAREVGFSHCQDLLVPVNGVEAGVRYFLKVGGVAQRYYASRSRRDNNIYAGKVDRNADQIARMIDL